MCEGERAGNTFDRLCVVRKAFLVLNFLQAEPASWSWAVDSDVVRLNALFWIVDISCDLHLFALVSMVVARQR